MHPLVDIIAVGHSDRASGFSVRRQFELVRRNSIDELHVSILALCDIHLYFGLSLGHGIEHLAALAWQRRILLQDDSILRDVFSRVLIDRCTDCAIAVIAHVGELNVTKSAGYSG